MEEGALEAGISDSDARAAGSQVQDDGSNEEIRLLEFEVMDSEDSDGEDDPFRMIQRKRSSTAPTKEQKGRAGLKRSKTDPNQSGNKPDLLTVLLPDNYDLSASNSNFSILQESTQMTTTLSSREKEVEINEYDLQTALDTSEALSEGQVETSEEPLEFISHTDFLNAESRAKNEPKGPEKKHKKASTAEKVNVRAEEVKQEIAKPSEEDNDQVEEPQEKDFESGNVSNDDRASHKTNTEASEEGAQEPKKKEEAQPTLKQPQNRPIKRKSTLAELCARKSPVPHRVGLSRRANINRLHSYLAKK